MRHLIYLFLAVQLLATASIACAEGTLIGYGVELEGFPYPYAVGHSRFVSQGQDLQMSYMDVPAKGRPNGHTVVLMHGKNFCGATWEATISVLADAGYRVVVPDQIGFCASTKPAHYQYSFQQLASNTMILLKHLGVSRSTLIGHSTGGMLATRFALMYPEAVENNKGTG